MEAARYPAYRDSGLPWAPCVPEGWQTLRNGRLFTHRVQSGFPDLPILEVSLRTGVRIRDMENLKRKQVMREKEKYKRAAKGDIAYNMMRMWQGALGTAPVDGLVSPAYVVACPFLEANSEYYSYLFRTAAYMREVNKFSRGIVADRNRLYWDEFKQMPALLPPRHEQDQIVAYLRAQDAHIARFIKVKRELIALLNERRQGINHRLLTGGAETNFKHGQPGVDWLVGVPATWEIVNLRQISLSLQTGPFGSQLHAEDYVDNGRPVINPSNLTQGAIVPDTTCSVDEKTARRLSRHWLQPGDVIFARRGELGRCALVTEQEAGWLCGTGSLRMRMKPGAVDPSFLMLILASPALRGHLRLQSVGATMENANTSIIGSIRIPLPPRVVQLSIAKQLYDAAQPIDEAIARAGKEIKLIREYRDRLIADVVTGQVDVRSWVPGPDDEMIEDVPTALADDDEPNTDGELADGDD